MKNRLDHRAKCIPLSLHGDGTPAMGVGKAWGKLIDIWSWSSLLVTGRSNLTIFLIFCVHSVLRSVEAGHNTLETAFQKMTWSFNALWEGKWPSFDWSNRKLLYAKASCLRGNALERNNVHRYIYNPIDDMSF